MKYLLVKEQETNKVFNIELSKNNYLLKLKKQEILIINQRLIDRIILKEVLKILNPILNKILAYLTSEEDNSDETTKLFDELAKQRGIILKKYDKYLSLKAKDEYLKKVRFLALELKKRLISYNFTKEKAKTR